MNTRLTNRLTAVPSFDGKSLPRAKEIDSSPERLRPLLDHDQGTARPEPAPYLVASAFRCSRTPPRAYGPGRFFVAGRTTRRIGSRDGPGTDLRHDAAGRRAVARHLAGRGREARDRR